MANFDPTFWLLVAFVIFVLAVFKKGKFFVSKLIADYKNAVINKIESAETQKHNSATELEKLKNHTTETEKMCQQIINSAINEANQIEAKSTKEVESYLTFKAKYTEEKIAIFTRQKLNAMKSAILEEALILTHNYLTANKQKAFDSKEFAKLLTQNEISQNK
jgi:F0F1-type ATP synthase membrane subunit b/b'